MSKQDTSKCPDPPRNCQKRTWDHLKSLADQDPTHSPSSSPSNSGQSTQSSMCHSWNWQNQTLFPTIDNPPPSPSHYRQGFGIRRQGTITCKTLPLVQAGGE